MIKISSPHTQIGTGKAGRWGKLYTPFRDTNTNPDIPRAVLGNPQPGNIPE